MTDRYLSLSQTARRAGVSERTLKRYLPQELQKRMGRKVVVNWCAFRDWLDSRYKTIHDDDIVMDILKSISESRIN